MRNNPNFEIRGAPSNALSLFQQSRLALERQCSHHFCSHLKLQTSPLHHPTVMAKRTSSKVLTLQTETERRTPKKSRIENHSKTTCDTTRVSHMATPDLKNQTPTSHGKQATPSLFLSPRRSVRTDDIFRGLDPRELHFPTAIDRAVSLSSDEDYSDMDQDSFASEPSSRLPSRINLRMRVNRDSNPFLFAPLADETPQPFRLSPRSASHVWSYNGDVLDTPKPSTTYFMLSPPPPPSKKEENGMFFPVTPTKLMFPTLV